MNQVGTAASASQSLSEVEESGGPAVSGREHFRMVDGD